MKLITGEFIKIVTAWQEPSVWGTAIRGGSVVENPLGLRSRASNLASVCGLTIVRWVAVGSRIPFLWSVIICVSGGRSVAGSVRTLRGACMVEPRVRSRHDGICLEDQGCKCKMCNWS